MIDWQQLLAQVGGNVAIVAAVAWLGRSLLVQSFSRDLETHKAKLQAEIDIALEHLRIHDRERTEAFKRLYTFAIRVKNETFPLAEDRKQGFDHTMKTLYWSKLQMDQIYFQDRVDVILGQFADMHVCIQRPELAEDTADETDAFLGKEAFQLAEELAELARAATEPIRGAVQHGDAVGRPLRDRR